MRTALDTPEIDAYEEYGVIWDLDQTEPYSEYADLEEAKQVAKLSNGYLMVRRITVGGWEVLSPEAL